MLRGRNVSGNLSERVFLLELDFVMTNIDDTDVKEAQRQLYESAAWPL